MPPNTKQGKREIRGQCLCGAVKVRAMVDNPILRACNCDMCRQHTSGAFVSIETVSGSVQVTGPATSFRSSDWAQRGFCSVCGSTLWYGTIADGERHLAAGLFENAGDARLSVEYFSDHTPAGYRFAGDHRRMTTEETIRYFTQDE